jgi:CO/xanthine dehydrogenase Mo-binding subunit
VTIRLRVNGVAHAVAVDPDTPLLFVLTDDLALRGPRFGCGMAQCGSCTVMLNGQPVRSCVIRARYTYPYQMHGSVGPSCAVADVRADGVTVWSPTQSAYPTRSCVASLLGVPVETVRVVFKRGSGCYGLNGADAVSFDAAIETVFVPPPGVPSTGAGETSITLVRAALANAVFDATGARLRDVPFTPPRVLAALRAAGSAT